MLLSGNKSLTIKFYLSVFKTLGGEEYVLHHKGDSPRISKLRLPLIEFHS